MALDTWGLYTINSRVLVGQCPFFTYLNQNEEINEMFGSLSRPGRSIQCRGWSGRRGCQLRPSGGVWTRARHSRRVFSYKLRVVVVVGRGWVVDVLNVGSHAIEEMIAARVAPRLALMGGGAPCACWLRSGTASSGRADSETTRRIDVFSPWACEVY